MIFFCDIGPNGGFRSRSFVANRPKGKYDGSSALRMSFGDDPQKAWPQTNGNGAGTGS
jgi:hypothetical protein